MYLLKLTGDTRNSYLCPMILVTGASGLLGSHLIGELVKRGQKIRCLYRSNKSLKKAEQHFCYLHDSPELIHSRIEWVQGDLLDYHSLEKALKGVHQVYHCAAMVSFRNKDRDLMYLINQKGTANLVDACLLTGGIRFCHVSSVAALGRNVQGEVINEENHWKTNYKTSAYAISKYAAEREVWRAAEEGLEMFIVNPSVILGPGNWKTDSSRIFHLVYRGMPFYTSGVTGYVDVRDVVNIMVRLMESSLRGERYIISAENVAIRDLFTMIANNFQKRPPFIPVPEQVMKSVATLLRPLSWLNIEPPLTRDIARASHNRYYYDNSKIRKLLSYEFIPIENSVRDTCQHYLQWRAKNFKT